MSATIHQRCSCGIGPAGLHRHDLPDKIEDLAERAAGFVAAGNDLMRHGRDKHAFRSAQTAYRMAVLLAGDAARLAPVGRRFDVTRALDKMLRGLPKVRK